VANNNRGRVPEQERCRGTSRQSKERCKRRRSPGSGYCIFHGGRVPKGGAHPNFKDGGRSKYMPRRCWRTTSATSTTSSLPTTATPSRSSTC
jgi:hypothetical protein